jgi:hypothetical protein
MARSRQSSHMTCPYVHTARQWSHMTCPYVHTARQWSSTGCLMRRLCTVQAGAAVVKEVYDLFPLGSIDLEGVKRVGGGGGKGEGAHACCH